MEPQATPFDLTVTDLLLSTTRAVRRRLDLDKPVAAGVILECLRLAVQAPTSGNTQTWRWIVVTDPELKSEIADVYRAEGMGYLEEALAEARTAEEHRIVDSALFLANNLQRVPVMVLPCINERADLTDNSTAAATYGSIIPATWSFQLALRARGLGSTFTTLHLSDERAVADLLGIPDDVTQVSMLPVAYTKGHHFKPAQRPPVENITYWNAWGSTEL